MENKAEKVVGYDYMLLIPTLLLMSFGLVAVYSASSFLAEHKMGDSYYYLKKQGMFCLVGLVLMICATNVPSTVYTKIVYPLLGISFLLDFLVLIPGGGTKAR